MWTLAGVWIDCLPSTFPGPGLAEGCLGAGVRVPHMGWVGSSILCWWCVTWSGIDCLGVKFCSVRRDWIRRGHVYNLALSTGTYICLLCLCSSSVQNSYWWVCMLVRNRWSAPCWTNWDCTYWVRVSPKVIIFSSCSQHSAASTQALFGRFHIPLLAVCPRSVVQFDCLETCRSKLTSGSSPIIDIYSLSVTV